MASYQGLLFDLECLIVDTAKFYFLAWRKMANTLGMDINEEQNEQLRGISRKESRARILAGGNLALPQDEVEKF